MEKKEENKNKKVSFLFYFFDNNIRKTYDDIVTFID